MTENDQLKQQLQKQEKLASLGMLSAGIAHEIQNPLNFVINFSKMSSKLVEDLTAIVEDNAECIPKADREDLSDIVASLKENMEQIVGNGERAVSIIQGILLVSRGKENEFLPSDVCHIVNEYVHLSYHAMRANHAGFNVTLHEQYQEDLPHIMVIPQDLSRAVLNVMNNACYAVWHKAQTAGEDYKPCIDITVTAHRSPLTPHPSPLPTHPSPLTTHPSPLTTHPSPLTTHQSIVISIADNGEGMTDEVKQHLYDNFFTTKPIGEGTGLGMSITRDIIENKHGGKMTFTSTEGMGTTFTFTLPVVK